MFIQEIEEGDEVRYYPIKGQKHDGKIYTVRKIGVLGHGEAVAWLAGKSGCVAMTHLGPVD